LTLFDLANRFFGNISQPKIARQNRFFEIQNVQILQKFKKINLKISKIDRDRSPVPSRAAHLPGR